MYKRLLLALAAILALMAPPAALGAINYGGNSYSAPFAASTTERVSDLVSGFDDTGTINYVNPTTTTIGTMVRFFGTIQQFFIDVNDWLRVHAGIDFFGILITIGHWFMIFLEWIVSALKTVLPK